MRRPTVLASALAVASVLLGGCTGPSTGTDEPGATIRSAVAATRAAGSAQVRTVSSASFGGTTITISSTATLRVDGSKVRASMVLPSGRVGSSRTFDVRLVVVGTTAWYAFVDPSPVSGEWGRAPLSAARSDGELTLPALWRMPDWLASVERARDMVDQGAETLEGTSTHRYSGRLATADDALAASLGQFVGDPSYGVVDAVPLEVWLDEQGRIVRLRESWDAPGELVSGHEVVTVDLDGFGATVTAEPPKGQVSTLTPGQMLVLAERA